MKVRNEALRDALAHRACELDAQGFAAWAAMPDDSYSEELAHVEARIERIIGSLGYDPLVMDSSTHTP